MPCLPPGTASDVSPRHGLWVANACQLSPLLAAHVANLPVSSPHESALAWALSPNMTSRGCSCISTKTRLQPHKPRHSGALNSQKCLVAPGLMLTSRSSPRKYPLAPECLVLRFLINHLCLEGKPSKRESEKDHFEFEVGKNKDNSLQNVEISSHIKETFDLCPSYANALLS